MKKKFDILENPGKVMSCCPKRQSGGPIEQQDEIKDTFNDSFIVTSIIVDESMMPDTHQRHPPNTPSNAPSSVPSNTLKCAFKSVLDPSP